MFVPISDGAELYVEMIGDGPEKPLLIALHGGPGVSDHRETKASFGFLSDRFRVLVFDARGSGESKGHPPPSHARWVADVDELRAWAGASTFVLAGGSYGGFIALSYALAHPLCVAALILRGTSAEARSLVSNGLDRALSSPLVVVDEAQLRRLYAGTLRDDADFERAMRSLLPLYTAPIGKDAQASRATMSTEFGFAVNVSTHNRAFSTEVPHFDVTADLKDIRTPTLIMVGRHDWATPVVCSELLHDGIRESELAIFERSGHSPAAEEPELFRATVRDFLDRRLR